MSRPASRLPPDLIPLAALAAAFAAMAALSWGRWADPFVDHGARAYAAWRLAEGAAWGRDLRVANAGPLAPHWNALLFRLFGPSLRVLWGFNLALVAALALLLYRHLGRLAGRSGGAAAGLLFLTVFAFGQYVGISGYNFVAPYAYAATYGFALSAAALALLSGTGGRREAGAGVLLGLLFLCKAEHFLGAAAGAAAHLALAGRPGGAVRLAAGFAAALGAAFLAFASRLGAADAFRALGTAWLLPLSPGLTGQAFVRAGLGLDQPWRNLALDLGAAGAAAGALGAVLAAERRLPAGRTAWGAAAGAAAAALAWLLYPWTELPRVLPFAALACLAGAWRLRREPGPERAAALAAWAVYALVLLARLGLYPRVRHYGFVLALPAAALAAAWLLGLLPERLARRRPDFLRAAFAVLLGALAAGHVRLTAAHLRVKTLPVGAEGERILSFGPPWTLAADLGEALEELQAAGGRTLTVLPEGLSLNYWLRRRDPSRILFKNPLELAALGGAEALLDDLRRDPPDHVLLADWPMHEYGVGRFHADPAYGKPVWDWVRERYRLRRTLRPFGSGDPWVVGLELWERR